MKEDQEQQLYCSANLNLSHKKKWTQLPKTTHKEMIDRVAADYFTNWLDGCLAEMGGVRKIDSETGSGSEDSESGSGSD